MEVRVYRGVFLATFWVIIRRDQKRIKGLWIPFPLIRALTTIDTLSALEYCRHLYPTTTQPAGERMFRPAGPCHCPTPIDSEMCFIMFAFTEWSCGHYKDSKDIFPFLHLSSLTRLRHSTGRRSEGAHPPSQSSSNTDMTKPFFDRLIADARIARKVTGMILIARQSIADRTADKCTFFRRANVDPS